MAADIVDAATRSRMMAGIKGKNTKPELVIRSGLHKMGFRFRIHDKRLPGKPDIVLPKWKAVILVHGCFWHGHDCALYRTPKSRNEFWEAKIARNRERDAETEAKLLEAGWRVLHVWECALKGKNRIGLERTLELADDWIHSHEVWASIRGL